MWDESWDVISHKDYKDIPRDEKFWLGDPYKLFKHEVSDVTLKELPYSKFDGGWMTMYNKDLLKLIDIPDSLGHYGLDDTFVVDCSNALMKKGYDIKHYILQDVVVMEDRVYRSSSMDPFISLVDHKSDMRDNSTVNYQNEINKFLDKSLTTISTFFFNVFNIALVKYQHILMTLSYFSIYHISPYSLWQSS